MSVVEATTVLLAASGLAGGLAAAPPAMQAGRGSDRPAVATVEALLTYPLFFHAQRVIVRGQVETRDDSTWLVVEERRLLLAGSTAGSASGIVDVRGWFFDVGRLESEDPRVATFRLDEMARRRLGRDRPGVGELLLLQVESVEPVPPAGRLSRPGLRALAIEPARFIDQRVTVTGRFRGRNLYGDLPTAPGVSSWDFVLRSADAAVWVTGRRPRGRGFDLNPGARVDTGRWLEVTGIVRGGRGLTWIEAQDIRTTEAETEPTVVRDVVPPPPPPAPPPEVVFSAPTSDETDVARSTRVRIQFSRDMDPASFAGRVSVAYLAAQSIERGEPEPPALVFTIEYRSGDRVLEIRFAAPLDRFRTVRVELGEGIVARDRQPLKPWVLTFSLGGS